MKATDRLLDAAPRLLPGLERHLYITHGLEVASSALGAALALVVGASLILSFAGLIGPTTATAVAVGAVLTGCALTVGRHLNEKDYRRDLANVVWQRLPHHPQRKDLRAALTEVVDDLATVYWRRRSSSDLRAADEEHRLVALMSDLLVDASVIAQWLELLGEDNLDAPPPPRTLRQRKSLSEASFERYREALRRLETTRQALLDQRESLEVDFQAVIAQIENLCIAARQLEIGQARLGTVIREQVLNSEAVLDGVRAHVKSLDNVIARTRLEGDLS